MIISLALSQKSVEIEKNPCTDRTITFARKYGVKALPVKDLPQFFKASKACSCLLYTSPSPRDAHESRMPSSA